MQGLVLARDTLSQNVVYEPVEIDRDLGLLLLGLLFLLTRIVASGRRKSLDGHELFELFQLLLEVILPGVIALEFDGVDCFLGRLRQGVVFDEVFEAEPLLLVLFGIFNFLVDGLLPSDMLRIDERDWSRNNVV